MRNNVLPPFDRAQERLAKRVRYGGVKSRITVAALCLTLLLGAAGLIASLYGGASKLEREISKGVLLEKVDPVEIYPDYVDCVVPYNIAPLNFEIRQLGSAFLTRFSVEGSERSFVISGKIVRLGLKRWRELLEEARGKKVVVEIYARGDGRVWRAFKPFFFSVSSDPIDSWLHYRLIEPGYEYFNRVTLVERNVETFDEHTWFDAKAVSERTCANCHTFQAHDTKNFLFHMRRRFEGTVLCENGKLTKLDPRVTGSDLGAAYAAWNPQKDVIAFSSNSTFQMFHSLSPDRIEVVDAASDLLLYDVAAGKSVPICETNDVLETFPSWSPDGKTLYYCAARSPYSSDSTKGKQEEADACENVFANVLREKYLRQRLEAVERYDRFHYSLTRRSFDPSTLKFGEPETLVDAEALGKSIAHPRVDPDGKTIVYTLSKYGTFPIWRRDADLWTYDLTTGETRELTELNSAESESWHEWDSSGRWLIFSSRREDGALTRVYIAHRAEDGNWSKPFMLPQRDPRSNIELVKSYNLPTPTRESIQISARKLTDAARKP